MAAVDVCWHKIYSSQIRYRWTWSFSSWCSYAVSAAKRLAYWITVLHLSTALKCGQCSATTGSCNTQITCPAQYVCVKTIATSGCRPCALRTRSHCSRSRGHVWLWLLLHALIVSYGYGHVRQSNGDQRRAKRAHGHLRRLHKSTGVLASAGLRRAPECHKHLLPVWNGHVQCCEHVWHINTGCYSGHIESVPTKCGRDKRFAHTAVLAKYLCRRTVRFHRIHSVFNVCSTLATTINELKEDMW
jgi:hypothetical protein